MEDARGKDRKSSGGAAKPKANSSPNYLKPQNRSPKAITQQTREKIERAKSPKKPPKGLPISKSTGNLQRVPVGFDCKDRTPTPRSYSKSPPKPLTPSNYVSGKKYQKKNTSLGTDGKPVRCKPVPRRDSLTDRAGLRRTSVERVAAQEKFRFQSREIIPKRTDQLAAGKIGKIPHYPIGVEKKSVRSTDEKKEEAPTGRKKNEKNTEELNEEETESIKEDKLLEKTYAEKNKELPCEWMKEEKPSENRTKEEKECKSGVVKNKDKAAEKMRKKSDVTSVMNEEILKPLELLNLDGN